MAQVNLSDYKNLYLQTAKEYLSSLILGYSKLTENIQDKDAVDMIHLAAHSLKGQSQVMNFESMANLCASVEKKSKDIVSNICPINGDFVNLLKTSIDGLKLELYRIEGENVA
jgi:chemotaxis protein histidine kinase CheA